MKIIVIGDIHGRDVWKEILLQEKGDYTWVVFIGDYFDSFRVDGNTQIQNFLDIVEFKYLNPSNVKLLLGNHDIHYHPGHSRCSGYQYLFAPAIKEVLKEHFDALQVCFEVDKYLFTHAGLTKTWMNTSGFDKPEDINCYPQHYERFGFNGRDSTGNNVTQGPFWVRPPSLKADRWGDKIQVVGHTIQDTITITDKIIFVDALEYNNEYLVINLKEHQDEYYTKTVG